MRRTGAVQPTMLLISIAVYVHGVAGAVAQTSLLAPAADGGGTAAIVPQPEVVAALWPADPFAPGFSLGNHRAEIDVPAAARSHSAVLVHVVWRRRSQPNATIVV
eukprot:COSAG06_NODE_47147_length_341_cov_0.855372_1_plen_104_part_10